MSESVVAIIGAIALGAVIGFALGYLLGLRIGYLTGLKAAARITVAKLRRR